MAFMKGKGAILTLFIDSNKVDALDVETWSIEPVKEEIADGVNGEDRDRLDAEIKYYKLDLSCFNATADKLKKILDYDDSLDEDAADPVQFGVKLKSTDGTSDLFTLKECVIDSWKWASGGRVNRQMLTIPIRGTRFKKLAA